MTDPPAARTDGRMVLVAGTSGYVAAHLLPELVRRAYRVRCLECWPEKLWGTVPEQAEVVPGDLHDAAALMAALDGVDTAFYMVHALSASGPVDADRRAARTFSAAARAASVRRVVYFGGFRRPPAARAPVDPHDIGDALRSSGVPVIEFRASVVIGDGSPSFELIRTLVERLPVVPAPAWMRAPVRPTLIGDVVSCLIEAADAPVGAGTVVTLCGPEVTTYAELMREYARVRGLPRWIVPVPLPWPVLSRLGLSLVAPRYARIGGRMIDGARQGTAGCDAGLPEGFTVRLVGARQAIGLARQAEESELLRARWSRAVSIEDAVRRWGGARFRNRFVDSRVANAEVSPAVAYAAIEGIGGANGWYSAPFLWWLRGVVDRMVGGPGMGRPRRDAARLEIGDVVDCWRVVAAERERRLLLSAEMKLPGSGWLEFEVHPEDGGRTASLRQTASFDPHGLTGLLYWYLSWPFHQLVFEQMIRGLAEEAERIAAPGSGTAGDRTGASARERPTR